ncbi:MAG TPA: serine/threonine-protein kinase [Ktedonobacteraceae bacterium]|nr:serine/threonine-protein kinase [Ktedonobacteraceae bacterium]
MDGKSNPTDNDYQKGQMIGRYNIVEKLQQEQLVDTFLGRGPDGTTLVMLKVLRPPLSGELEKSFLMQAPALMQLKHPNILRLRDAAVDNHTPFLVSDYISHLTLRQVFPQGSVQPLSAFLPYLRQAASALQYAHDRHVLHGDIRPDNMLLHNNNQILLANFTIEAIIQNRERLNYKHVESIAYSAPEKIQGKAGPASDQYSLAIVVYELLSGGVPFTKSYLEIASQQLHTPPPSMREKVPDISSRVEKIVMTALAKDPAKRFANVQAFVNALEQAQGLQLRDTTSPKTPPPPAVPQPKRQPVANAPVALPKDVPAQPLPYRQSTVYSPAPPAQLPPSVPPPPAFENSPLAARRDQNTFTRRAFAIGLVGLAVAGGVGSWYALSQRLAKPVPPTVTPNEVPPATQTTINNKNALIFTGHLASVNAVTWSPDGRLIASASDDTFVQVFDALSGKRKLIYTGHSKEVTAVAWSPNGKFIASGSEDGTVQVWDATNGNNLLTYKGHTDRVNGVSWSRDSRQIVSGSEDKTVQVWNAANGALIFTFKGHTSGVLCVGWQPNETSVASGSWDGTLRDWATQQHGNHFNAGDQIFNYGGHGKNEVTSLAWSPNGKFIASAGADQTVQISNGVDGTLRPPIFTGHLSKQHLNPVRSVSWSPDGNLLVSGDSFGTVYVWTFAGRKIIFTYQGQKGVVNAVEWSPDGRKVASAGSDTTVQIWQPS